MSDPAADIIIDPMILAVAPTGARRGKRDHTNIPLTIAEIVAEAKACMDAGASLLHLHVRSKDGRHSLDPGTYTQTIRALRKEVGDGLLIQATTEAAGLFGPEQQIETARAVPADSISLAVRELCPDTASETQTGDLYHNLHARKILMQHIVYDLTDLQRVFDLNRSGVIPERQLFLQLVLGRYSEDLRGGPAELVAFLGALQGSSAVWSVCCFGSWESQAVMTAAALGGHARIGFENNDLLPDGSIAGSNTELLTRHVKSATAGGRRLATAADIRLKFGLPMDITKTK